VKLKGIRWYMVALLMGANIVNYLDRNCLSVAAPTFMKDLDISKIEYSYIVSGFLVAYMISQPVMGRFMDWIGTRIGFMFSVGWWSIANMLHALAGSWVSFSFFRFLLGIGEGGMFPGAIKTISEWFPAKERTVATGFMNMGSSVGGMIAPPLIAFIILTWHWQAAFVITGAVGVVWVALWFLFYQPLDKHKHVTQEEADHIRAGQADQRAAEQVTAQDSSVWGMVLRQRNFWGMGIARFLSEPAWQFFVFWIPVTLMDTRGLDLKGIAIFAWMPFLASDLGCIFGGYLSPFFIRLGMPVLTARKAAATVCGILMMTAIFIGTDPPAWMAQMLAKPQATVTSIDASRTLVGMHLKDGGMIDMAVARPGATATATERLTLSQDQLVAKMQELAKDNVGKVEVGLPSGDSTRNLRKLLDDKSLADAKLHITVVPAKFLPHVASADSQAQGNAVMLVDGLRQDALGSMVMLSAGWAVLFFCIAAFTHQAMSSTLLTLPADLFPHRAVATAYGLGGTIGYIGGWLFTLMVGWLATNVGYAPIFVTIAFLDLIAAGVLWVFLRAPQEMAAEASGMGAPVLRGH